MTLQVSFYLVEGNTVAGVEIFSNLGVDAGNQHTGHYL